MLFVSKLLPHCLPLMSLSLTIPDAVRAKVAALTPFLNLLAFLINAVISLR